VLDSFSPQAALAIPQIFFCFAPPRAAPCKSLRLTTFFRRQNFPSFLRPAFLALHRNFPHTRARALFRPDPLKVKKKIRVTAASVAAALLLAAIS